ncbi:hypothetical protein [Nocardia testacea]|uniref:hypothetical protein n=1 Tax=Nocardia testacea TaxID=248551 RepID=UPI000584A198|nr:hypothetical protein [Nocardia testacea]
MSQEQALLQQWQTLKTQAESGELRMDADVGGKLVQRCDTFLDQLDKMLRQTDSLKFVDGFGGLASATKLRDKFADKAVKGPDSAANRIKTAIDIVTLMRQTFELSTRRIVETDDSTSTALGNAGA